MPKQQPAKRGRKPQISTASREVVTLKRQVRVLLTGLGRLQSRLVMLDAYHGKATASPALTRKGSQSKPGRKPNVRDLAAEILKRSKKPMPLTVLAQRVTKARGKKSGKMFAMNLGTALRNDRRFRRVGRGVYGLNPRFDGALRKAR